MEASTEGVRRSEAEIKKFIRESDSVSLSWIREALSREENRREARWMREWMESEERASKTGRARAGDEVDRPTLLEIYEAETIEEMRNG
jgi:hypothetical protein